MEQISENFTMKEFAVTSTGLPNDIPVEVKPAIRALVNNLLQPLCDGYGWRCKINSGYRSKAVNAKVGGVSASQHTTGQAADTVYYTAVGAVIPPFTVLQALTDLRLDFDQAILYPSFVHLSYTVGQKNRKQVLYHSSYKGKKL